MSKISQAVILSMISLMIIIIFFGLANAVFEMYYLGSTLTPKQQRSQKILKLLLYIPIFLLVLVLFVGLILLMRFLINNDIVEMIEEYRETMVYMLSWLQYLAKSVEQSRTRVAQAATIPQKIGTGLWNTGANIWNAAKYAKDKAARVFTG